MARPIKHTVDYFSHDTNASAKKTLTIVESKFGNDGYSFWYKLLELLGETPGHFIDCRNESTWEFLQAKTHLDDITCRNLLELLSKLDAIDSSLWHDKKVIWSDNFVDRISDVYRNRRQPVPNKPFSNNSKPSSGDVSTDNNPTTDDVSTTKSTQTKLNKTKDNYYNNYLKGKEKKKGKKIITVYSIYEENIGILTPMVSEQLKDIEKEYSQEWFEEAVKVACENNVRKLSYISKILENWRVNGFKTKVDKGKDNLAERLLRTSKYKHVN